MSATSIEVASPELSAQQQDAVRFRTEFGLQADLEYIAQVAADPSASLAYGVPLLPSEVADLRSREVGAAAAAPLIDAYGDRFPDSFAGWYLDQEHGGVIVVLFTRDLKAHLLGLWESLLTRTPPVPVQVRPASRTLQELNALQDRITQDTQAWAARGIRIVFLGTRISENLVEIGVLAPVDMAEQRLSAEYGADAIHVFVSDEPPQTG